MFFDIKDYRMSRDNQDFYVASAVSSQASSNVSSEDSTDKTYKVAILLSVALIYMVYISPMMRTRAVTEKTAVMKATFRWIDLLTKLVIVYLIAFATTNNVSIAVVITLIFLLFMTQYRDTIIETKNRSNNVIEKMTGDEDDLDEKSDIDSVRVMTVSDDFKFKRDGNNFIYESDSPVLFPLNNGSIEPDMADEVDDIYDKPKKVAGLVVDTVAESEQIANAQGLGMDLLNRFKNEVQDVIGVDL
jgi:hypothetical protein